MVRGFGKYPQHAGIVVRILADDEHRAKAGCGGTLPHRVPVSIEVLTGEVCVTIDHSTFVSSTTKNTKGFNEMRKYRSSPAGCEECRQVCFPLLCLSSCFFELSAVLARIELGVVGQPARVMDLDLLTRSGGRTFAGQGVFVYEAMIECCGRSVSMRLFDTDQSASSASTMAAGSTRLR